MPRRKLIDSLYSIILEQILFDLNDALCDEQADVLRIREFIRSALPAKIIQEMVTVSIKLFYQHGNLVEILQVLLDSNFRKLCLYSEDIPYYLTIEDCIKLYGILQKHNFSNLESLSLATKVNPRSELPYIKMANMFIHLTLYQLKNLTSLTMRGLCDNMSLSILGKNAKNLTYIDVSNSALVDDEGVFAFINFAVMPVKNGEVSAKKVTLFGLGDTNVTEDSVRRVLVECDNLESFGGSLPCSFLSVIEDLSPEKEYKLAEIWEDRWEKRFLKNFPKLMKVHTHLKYLVEFPTELNVLEVDLDFSVNVWQLYAYLNNYGSKVTHLKLRNQNTPVCMSYIFELCPVLNNFQGKGTVLDPIARPITSLVTMSLTCSSSEAFAQVLKNVPNLTSLTLRFEEEPYEEKSDCINDGLLKRVLKSKGLGSLEIFQVETPLGLTKHGLDCLIESCPSLNFVCDLSNFKDFSEVDFENMKEQVFQNNFDLNLRIYGRTSV